MRTNNAHFNVAPRNLSLEPVTFRPKFHETISCGQLRNYSKRRSLPCGARAQFLLAQLGSGRSEWGANGERNRQTDEADKSGSRSTRKWNTVVGAAEVPLGGNKKASSTKIAALWELGIGPALVALLRKHSHALESSGWRVMSTMRLLSRRCDRHRAEIVRQRTLRTTTRHPPRFDTR